MSSYQGSLPSELWSEEIIHYMEPLDVLYLSQTNKSYHECFTQQGLWKDILRRTCQQEGIFPPTFPAAEMTDLAHIQRAATGPQRWRRLVSRYGVPAASLIGADSDASRAGVGAPLPLRAETHIACPCIEDRDPRVDTLDSKMQVIPGGRFVLKYICLFVRPGSRTFNRAPVPSAVGVCVQLWDLGVPGRRQCNNTVDSHIGGVNETGSRGTRWADATAVLVAEAAVPIEGEVDLENPHLSAITSTVGDNSVLRVATMFWDEDDLHGTAINVFSIDLGGWSPGAGTPPAFEKIASLTIPWSRYYEEKVVAMNHDQLYLLCESSMCIVWNFTHHALSIIDLDIAPPRDEHTRVYRMFFFTETVLASYEVPFLDGNESPMPPSLKAHTWLLPSLQEMARIPQFATHRTHNLPKRTRAAPSSVQDCPWGGPPPGRSFRSIFGLFHHQLVREGRFSVDIFESAAPRPLNRPLDPFASPTVFSEEGPPRAPPNAVARYDGAVSSDGAGIRWRLRCRATAGDGCSPDGSQWEWGRGGWTHPTQWTAGGRPIMGSLTLYKKNASPDDTKRFWDTQQLDVPVVYSIIEGGEDDDSDTTLMFTTLAQPEKFEGPILTRGWVREDACWESGRFGYKGSGKLIIYDYLW